VVEGTCLENKRPFTRSVSSNLTSSALKYLGIDYGSKRIGLALSDESGTLAFPHSVIENNIGLMSAIESLIRDEKIDMVVMGESLSNDGVPNPIQEKIKQFSEALERKFEVPIIFEKEFMTSFEAHGREGKESLNARKIAFEKPVDLDARAAALILQRYLDKQK
jgi:putative holliday junction resolvase